MTPSHTAPGVYVEEVPPASRPVEGVPTSVTGFVGRALRGPVDRPVPVTTWVEFERTFGGLWAESGLGYAVRDFFLNGGTSAVVVRVTKDATAARISLGELEIEAHGPGSWADAMTATVSHPTVDEAAAAAQAQGLPDGESIFTLRLTCGAETETFPHVSAAPGPRRVDAVLASSNLARVLGEVPTTRPAAGAYGVVGGGHDGVAPDHGSFVTPDGSGRGIRALDGADLVNVLVLPPVSPSGRLPDSVWAPALEYAVRRRAFLIVDPPPGLEPAEVVPWVTGPAGLRGTGASHAAIYYPRLEQADPLRAGAVASFAASGSIAGAYARTDATRGVWKAPAGTSATLTGTLGPSVVLRDADNGPLNEKGVNVIRSLPGVGTAIWGSRTLRGGVQTGDEYRYVSVRRLALFIEDSLDRGLTWAVFEPNDPALWARIRSTVSAFLDGLFRQGAFQGATAREAYLVTCDAETTSLADIEAGVVTVMVGFAPVKPAEFVVVTLRVRTVGSTP